MVSIVEIDPRVLQEKQRDLAFAMSDYMISVMGRLPAMGMEFQMAARDVIIDCMTDLHAGLMRESDSPINATGIVIGLEDGVDHGHLARVALHAFVDVHIGIYERHVSTPALKYIAEHFKKLTHDYIDQSAINNFRPSV